METEVDDAALISIDSKGTDIRVRQGAQVLNRHISYDNCSEFAIVYVFMLVLIYFALSLQFNIQRLSFEEGHTVETLEEAKAALWKLIKKGPVHNLHT